RPRRSSPATSSSSTPARSASPATRGCTSEEASSSRRRTPATSSSSRHWLPTRTATSARCARTELAAAPLLLPLHFLHRSPLLAIDGLGERALLTGGLEVGAPL